jgi:hypothetical protein
MKRTVPEADPVAVARMKYEQENRTKQSMMSHFWGVFSARPNMSSAAKSGTPPMEGYRPQIPASVPASAATPGALGTNEVSISQPGSDSAIDKGAEVRANPGAPAEGAAAAAGTAPAAPAPAESAKPAADPNETAKAATMTPAEQKKAYKEALKKQQDSAKKAQNDRKKKEAQQAAAVKEQKRKSKEQQQKKPDQQPEAKPDSKPDVKTDTKPTGGQ